MILTSNIDGYIPLKFEAGVTYHVSYDGFAQGSALIPSHVQDQSSYPTSSGIQTSAESPQSVRGYHMQVVSEKSHVQNTAAPYTKTKAEEAQSEVDPRTAKLKNLIMNDRSGHAMRRLKAAAASAQLHNQAGDAEEQTDQLPPLPHSSGGEPVKPPRRGSANKKTRAEDGSDSADPDGADPHSSYMDVTAAL